MGFPREGENIIVKVFFERRAKWKMKEVKDSGEEDDYDTDEEMIREQVEKIGGRLKQKFSKGV